MTHRRWIAETWDETSATLVGAQAEHLARVLRAQPGVAADVVAGGRVFRAEVATVSLAGDASEVRFTLLAELDADPALPVTLALAIYKFDRMEWAIEKATELGVAAIAPVIARRTEKHLALAATKRAERWRRIAKEAAQQARRSDVPVIHDPIFLEEYVRAAAKSTLVSGSTAGATRLVLAEQERTTTLRYALEEADARETGIEETEIKEGQINQTQINQTEINQTLINETSPAAGAQMSAQISPQTLAQIPAIELAIGPEGGWAPSEEALFDANGWRAVSLGPRILRAETAAITALAVVASYLE